MLLTVWYVREGLRKELSSHCHASLLNLLLKVDIVENVLNNSISICELQILISGLFFGFCFVLLWVFLFVFCFSVGVFFFFFLANRKETYFNVIFSRKWSPQLHCVKLGWELNMYLLVTQKWLTYIYNRIFCNPESNTNTQEKANIVWIFF